jgi:hypothetical protein
MESHLGTGDNEDNEEESLSFCGESVSPCAIIPGINAPADSLQSNRKILV